MAEPYLKYRTRFTSSLKNELVPLFNQLSKDTRIPKSRLLDDAIEDILTKYGFDIPLSDDTFPSTSIKVAPNYHVERSLNDNGAHSVKLIEENKGAKK